MVNLNLRKRLFIVVSIIAAIVLINSIINCWILVKQKKDIIELNNWAYIDMIMNEDIIARVDDLKSAFIYWSYEPNINRWNIVKESFKNLKSGFNKLKTVVSNKLILKQNISRLGIQISYLNSNILLCSKIQDLRDKNLKELERKCSKLKSTLNYIMNNIIDPAKDESSRLGNIKYLKYWSNIDMIMNEDVIQQLISFQLAFENFITDKSDASKASRYLNSLKKGIKNWINLVKENPKIKDVIGNLMIEINQISILWDKTQKETQILKHRTFQVMKTISNIATASDKIMEGLIDPKKAEIVSDAITNANRYIYISVVILGIIILLIAVIAWGTNTVCRPLQSLIFRLKELATGEADLTKQLDVTAINCSQVLNCGNTSCPSYGKKSHCWYEAGSYAPVVFCPKIKNGIYKSCEECEVYKKAIITEIDEVSTFVNAFILRIRELVKRIKSQGEEVSHEAQNLSSVSEQLANGANETQSQAEKVNQVAETTGDEISYVASAIEEMTASIAEVSQHTSHASQIAQEASEEVIRTQQVIKDLAEASNKINEVSKLIGSIAEQTNLLALNATIEAARAGEAGKGFAVVANEVKELAKQTGNSVSEIDEMVKGLQYGANNALSAIEKIVEVINQVAELSNNIAAAIEEQTATTNEVSANTQKVNEDVNSMARMSQSIAAAGTQTSQGAQLVSETAKKLRNLSDDLMKLLGEFTV